MKKLLLLLAAVFISQLLSSQIPYKSASFAEDIIIQNTPSKDQRTVSFCSAINGWEHAIYSYMVPPVNGAHTMLRSTDDGEMWSVMVDHNPGFANLHTIKWDLVSTGDSLQNLYLIRLWQALNTLTGRTTITIVGIDFVYFSPQFYPGDPTTDTHDGAIAGDDLYPATGAEHSLGFVFSERYWNQKDSISVWVSDNKGFTWKKFRRIYGNSNKYLDKVDISYGHAPCVPDGKYFTVWEEKELPTSSGAHIYYSHNTAGFDSPFSTPVDLNQFLPGSNNRLGNPKIAVQSSAVNNGKGNLSVVVLAEKYDMDTTKKQVVGFYNDMAATDDNNWQSFILGDTSHNIFQPGIAFNPYDSTFMVVYFDSTDKKIPYLLHKFDFENPVIWNTVNTGINDSDSISNPNPQVKLVHSHHSGGVVWSSDNELGNGVARYDAPYNYYTGKKELPVLPKLFIYPNPASGYFNIDPGIEVKDVEVTLISSEGKDVRKINLDYASKITIQTDGLPGGLYFVKVRTNKTLYAGKVVLK